MMRHAIRVMRHGISHQWPLRHRDPSRSCPDRMDHRARLAGPIVRPALLAGDVEAAVDIAHLKHLIPQNDLLPIPRPGRHSHFSVRLALDDDGGLVAGREFFENFFGRSASMSSLSGHRDGAEECLVDHLIRGGEQRRWDFQAERFCSFGVNHKLKFCRLLNRKFVGFRAAQNFIHISRRDVIASMSGP
jgi:hypothetical protein